MKKYICNCDFSIIDEIDREYDFDIKKGAEIFGVKTINEYDLEIVRGKLVNIKSEHESVTIIFNSNDLTEIDS